MCASDIFHTASVGLLSVCLPRQIVEVPIIDISLIKRIMKYFTYSELLKSSTAIENKIWNGANKEQEANLKALVDAILDPLREKYGQPIRVSSGFRNAALNAAVGGVKTSQHCNGEAADISTGNRDENRKLAKMIVEMGLPFDQLIDENNYAWVHVSYKRNGENRGKILRYKNKAYYILSKENL